MSYKKYSPEDELKSEIKRILRLHGSRPIAADQILAYVNANWYSQLSGNRMNYEQFGSQSIIEAVCEHFSMSLESMTQTTRRHEVKYPRQVLSYFLELHSELTQEQVGDMLGQDRTTINYSRNVILKRLRKEMRVQSDVRAIRMELKKFSRVRVMDASKEHQLEAV